LVIQKEKLKFKQEILKRLNNKYTDITDWFNINRYLSYLGYPKREIKIQTKNIYDVIRNNLCELIFTVLKNKGLLSDLIPNKQVSDQTYTKHDRGSILSELKKIDDNYFDKNSIYAETTNSYLTDLPYKYSGFILSDLLSGKDEETIKKNNFLNNTGNRCGWFSAYALDWVSQIGFCHKFINQRVSYVTGATGVGKSTQVPKLYMYYLKALDYKCNGKVACTQPRRAPTKNNAQRVSGELGFPIIDDNDKSTDYFYVQMQHQNGKHVKQANHLMLKYLTDGTLTQELKQLHPLFKRFKTPKGKELVDANLYDVIIIDEAHEHNKNMDLLLTLMRDFCYFNPSIKLVILSATMDDDEPVYRRYYRDINDNLKSPLDTSIRDKNIDRVNIDRRFHISPPGLGTSFAIKEIYSKENLTDTITFAVETVKDILSKGGLPSGRDILVFQPGQGDIKKLVEKLNEVTPANIIAVPFYSELHDDKKSFIEDIDSKYNTLKMNKNISFADANVDELFTGSASYSNFIICATNMAEASITISRLLYVIETGTRKSKTYSYTRRGGKLETLQISESSRKQRKGRVGRTGPGTVYYSYKEGTMENNKILFDFSISNMSNDIFNWMCTDYDKQIVLENFIKDKKIMEQFGYLFSTAKGLYNYLGNINHYDFNYEKKYVPDKYETGYSSKTLYDAKCDFYIVHPEELDITRDIMGRVINVKQSRPDIILFNSGDSKSKYAGTLNMSTKSKNYGVIQSYKVDSFFEDLEIRRFITRKDNLYIGTPYGKLIMELLSTFTYYKDEDIANLLSTGILLNNEDNISKIISALLVSRFGGYFNIINILLEDEKKRYKSDFRKLFSKSTNSEADMLVQFADLIIKYFIKPNNILDFTVIDKEIAINKNLSDNYINNIMNNFKEDDNTDFDREKIIEERLGILTKSEELKQKIELFSKEIAIKPDIVMDFIFYYIITSNYLISIKNPNKSDRNFKDDILKYREEIYNVISPKINNIRSVNLNSLTFLMAQPFNIVKRIIPMNRFMSAYNPTSDNIYSLSLIKQERENKTVYSPYLLIDDMYTSNYILYFNIDITKDTMHLIIQIDKEYLKLFPELYNSDRLNKISGNKIIKIEKYLEKIKACATVDEKVKFAVTKSITDDINALVNLKTTYNEILRDIKSL